MRRGAVRVRGRVALRAGRLALRHAPAVRGRLRRDRLQYGRVSPYTTTYLTNLITNITNTYNYIKSILHKVLPVPTSTWYLYLASYFLLY